MKRIVITTIATFILAFGAAAQDTIRHNGPLPNYYFPFAGIFDEDTIIFDLVGCGPTITDDASGYVTNDTLTIYGIAAMLFACPNDDYEGTGYYQDTSLDKRTEFLRLYFPSADTLIRYQEQLPVNLKYTPVAYYLLIEKVCYPGWPQWPPDSFPPLPVYERYFSSPVQVFDTFYVGRSNETYRRIDAGLYTSPGVDVGFFTSMNHMYDGTYHFLNALRDDNRGWNLRGGSPVINCLFPILIPPDSNYVWDTTVVAGDTVVMGDTIIVRDTLIIGGDTIIQYDTILGIDDHGMLSRLTGVMPNPAAESAKVVSSFGISHIEAYNLAGQKVDELRLPSPSLSATLDVRRWPAGAYILRIHTPQGTATKKLTVAR